MTEKVSRDRGYRSDTIAPSRDMGPLSLILDIRELQLRVGESSIRMICRAVQCMFKLVDDQCSHNAPTCYEAQKRGQQADINHDVPHHGHSH